MTKPCLLTVQILCRSLPVCVVLFASAAMLSLPAQAVDHVQIKEEGRVVSLTGKVLVEAEDGGLLLQLPAGALIAVQPEELVSRESDDRPFEPATGAALEKAILAELPEGFRIHTTAHYVIAYNTSRAYAQWCGALYERLYASFFNYWERRGLKLEPPPQPLVALVFDSKESFARHARAELGEAAAAVIGYYSLQSNRVCMYDLTSTSGHGRRVGTAAQITAALSRPEAAATVATIIHEATHQLAFNSGAHQRYADIPMWLSEGLAVYFETPDLSSSRGWRTIGGINAPRVARMREYLVRRPADSLVKLLSDDARFRNTETALDAYAEAWVLNHYLINRYPDKYNEYLRRLAKKEPLLYDTPEERIEQFREVFGSDLDKLDRELVQYARGL